MKHLSNSENTEKRACLGPLRCRVILLTALLLTYCVNCRDYLSTHAVLPGGLPLVQPPSHSHDPYYGTGVVVRVGGEQVFIDFGSYDQPKYWGMTLLIIRDNRLAGRIKGTGPTGTGRPLLPMGGKLLEGTAEVGDMAIGVQNQREYKRPY